MVGLVWLCPRDRSLGVGVLYGRVSLVVSKGPKPASDRPRHHKSACLKQADKGQEPATNRPSHHKDWKVSRENMVGLVWLLDGRVSLISTNFYPPSSS